MQRSELMTPPATHPARPLPAEILAMAEPRKSTRDDAGATAASRLRQWLPLLAIVALMGLALAMGWHKYLSFKTIGLNYETLRAFIASNFLAALGLYVALYIGVVALSLPGGLVMTLAGGLLFGWKVGAPATIVGATIGAAIIFLVARSSLGETLAARAGPWIGKLREGFQENALSYLLFLRLVPAFPFFIVNLAPALLGVPLGTFLIGTAIGIMLPHVVRYNAEVANGHYGQLNANAGEAELKGLGLKPVAR